MENMGSSSLHVQIEGLKMQVIERRKSEIEKKNLDIEFPS